MQLTKAYLTDTARQAARDIARETGHRARLVDWRLIVESERVTLQVVVSACGGHHSRHVAV